MIGFSFWSGFEGPKRAGQGRGRMTWTERADLSGRGFDRASFGGGARAVLTWPAEEVRAPSLLAGQGRGACGS